MTDYIAEILVTPRAGLLDPEGHAVEGALHTLEFPSVRDVRVGRVIRLVLSARSDADARTTVDTMCMKLLANPVTEDYQVKLEKAS